MCSHLLCDMFCISNFCVFLEKNLSVLVIMSLHSMLLLAMCVCVCGLPVMCCIPHSKASLLSNFSPLSPSLSSLSLSHIVLRKSHALVHQYWSFMGLTMTSSTSLMALPSLRERHGPWSRCG